MRGQEGATDPPGPGDCRDVEREGIVDKAKPLR